MLSLQVRQEIAQEFERTKDISGILSSFKQDNPRPFITRDDPQYDEPTRDKDVWPPPTPVEYKPSPPLRGGRNPAARKADGQRGARPSPKVQGDRGRGAHGYGNADRDRRGRENRDVRRRESDKDKKVDYQALGNYSVPRRVIDWLIFHVIYSPFRGNQMRSLKRRERRSLIHLDMIKIWWRILNGILFNDTQMFIGELL